MSKKAQKWLMEAQWGDYVRAEAQRKANDERFIRELRRRGKGKRG